MGNAVVSSVNTFNMMSPPPKKLASTPHQAPRVGESINPFRSINTSNFHSRKSVSRTAKSVRSASKYHPKGEFKSTPNKQNIAELIFFGNCDSAQSNNEMIDRRAEDMTG